MILHEHALGCRDHRDDGCGQRAFMALVALAELVWLALALAGGLAVTR